MLKRRSHHHTHRIRLVALATSLLLAMLALAATAQGNDPRIDVSRDSIAFGDVTIGTPSRYEQVDVRNTTDGPLPLNVALHQGRGDYTVEAADGQNVNRTLAAGAHVRYLIRFSPTAKGTYDGTLAFYPGDAYEYRAGLAQASIVTLTGNGTDPAPPPQTTPTGLRPGTSDMDIQVTGRFSGNTPVFAGCCRPRGTSVHPRVVRESGRLGIRVINHGPLDEGLPHVTIAPSDRHLLDPQTLPSGIGPRSIQLLTLGGYSGNLAAIPAGGHIDMVVRVPRGGVPLVDHRLSVSIQGLMVSSDPNMHNNQDHMVILAGKPRPQAGQPGGAGNVPVQVPRKTADIDVDIRGGEVHYFVWPIETVHPGQTLYVGRMDTTPITVHVKNRGPDDASWVRLTVEFADRDMLNPSGSGLPQDCYLSPSPTDHKAKIVCHFPLASGDARDFVFKFSTGVHILTGMTTLGGKKAARIDVHAEGVNPSYDPEALNNSTSMLVFTRVKTTGSVGGR